MSEESNSENHEIKVLCITENCREQGRFSFREIRDHLEALSKLGALRKELDEDEEDDLRNEVFEALEYVLDNLRDYMQSNLEEFKILKDNAREYLDIVERAMVLLERLILTLTRPNDFMEWFKESCDETSPHKLGMKLADLAKKDKEYDFKKKDDDMNGQELMGTMKWRFMIEGFLTQLLYIETYANGLIGDGEMDKAKELKEKIEEFDKKWNSEEDDDDEKEEEERKRKEEEEKRKEEEERQRREEEERKRKEEDERQRKEEEERKRREEEEERKKKEEEEEKRRKEEEEQRRKEEEERKRKEEEERKRREEEEKRRKEEEERKRKEEEERKRKEEEEQRRKEEEERKRKEEEDRKRKEEEEKKRREEEEKRRKEEEERKRKEEEEKKRKEEEERKRREEEEQRRKEEEERKRKEEEDRKRKEEEERKRKEEEEEKRRKEEEERKRREEEERKRKEEEERKKREFDVERLRPIVEAIQDNNPRKSCEEKAQMIQNEIEKLEVGDNMFYILVFPTSDGYVYHAKLPKQVMMSLNRGQCHAIVYCSREAKSASRESLNRMEVQVTGYKALLRLLTLKLFVNQSEVDRWADEVDNNGFIIALRASPKAAIRSTRTDIREWGPGWWVYETLLLGILFPTKFVILAGYK